MQLQVRMVSTVISRTETRWENAIENSIREGKTRLKNRKCDSNAGSRKRNNQTRKHPGALTILLPLLQALNSLEVLVF